MIYNYYLVVKKDKTKYLLVEESDTLYTALLYYDISLDEVKKIIEDFENGIIEPYEDDEGNIWFQDKACLIEGEYVTITV